jgi:hypothetical protein
LEAHRDALWVVTVVGGRALTRALEECIPAISLLRWSLLSGVVTIRLFIFIVLSVRLFIGASIFFNKVHLQEDRDIAYPRRNYVLDFTSSIFHFSVLYWMALQSTSAANLPRFAGASEQFFYALIGVLMYDWLWWVVSIHYSARASIRKLATSNTTTGLACALLFLMFGLGSLTRGQFELALAAVVFLFGIPDMIRLTAGEMRN